MSTAYERKVNKMVRKLGIALGAETPEELVDAMVDRFLGWKLPKNFNPDCGISFTPEHSAEYMASIGKPPARYDPVGTNLFDALQAREMIEHMLNMPKKKVEYTHNKLQTNGDTDG